jgi:hypothetical protein
MSYWDYLGDLMRNQLRINWPLPHIWALVYGLEALQTVVEELVRLQEHSQQISAPLGVSVHSNPPLAPEATTQNLREEAPKPKLRTGFLCKGQNQHWYWVLTRHNYKTVIDRDASDISVLRNIGIPSSTGMIGALNAHILARQEPREEGAVFSSLEKNTLIDMVGYPPELAKVERKNWLTDEFIGEFLLGFVKVDQGLLSYDLWRSDANALAANELAIVFVYCTGLEPFAPRRVLDAHLSISKIKQFFWRFMKEYGPALRDASDALVRSAVASIMARNMSHNIGSHVSTRTAMDSIQRRLVELYE